MSSEWEISRPTGKCVTTGREFAEGEFYYAVLIDKPEGLIRQDYSVEGWAGPPEDSFCYWKARVPTKERKPATIAVDAAVLTTLFQRLEEDASEGKQKFRFVLALLLMRKRLLKFERASRQEDQEFWQMRLLADQSTHQVLNPQLSSEEIDRLSAQLTAILSGDVAAISALEEETPEQTPPEVTESPPVDSPSVLEEVPPPDTASEQSGEIG